MGSQVRGLSVVIVFPTYLLSNKPILSTEIVDLDILTEVSQSLILVYFEILCLCWLLFFVIYFSIA
jgi:hypothetical protein